MIRRAVFHPLMHGRPVGNDDSDGDGYRPWRRVACIMLLSAYLDSQDGSLADKHWLESPEARLLADLVDLPYWPPRPDEFYPLEELERRAAALSGPVHVSRSLFGLRLSPKERRARRAALHNELFANAENTTATLSISTLLSFWGEFTSAPLVGEVAGGLAKRAPH